MRGCSGVVVPVLTLIYAAGLTGCALGPDGAALVENRKMHDAQDLRAPEALPEVEVSARIPETFDVSKAYVSTLYGHQQWRTPTRRTATGVIHIRTLLPLGTKAVGNIAINEYTKRTRDNSGRLIARWVDSLGRQWFEAEDKTYHAKGFIMTRDSDAWLVYMGYRYTEPLEPEAIDLAEKSLQTVIPLCVEPTKNVAQVRLATLRPTTQQQAATRPSGPSFMRTMGSVMSAMRRDETATPQAAARD